MKRFFSSTLAFVAMMITSNPGESQPSQSLSLPPDSPRWELQGQAKATEYQGRKCLYLDGAAAVVKDLEMRDGVIDVDVATPASRGFFGFDFRIADNGANGERVYLRQHKSGLPDAMQYTPVLNTGANWQIYNGPGFTGIAATLDIPEEIGRLPREMETALFRIVQEALTNIQRHSGSTVARLRLRREPHRLRLEIEDEGRGLPHHLRDHDAALAASGLGIAGMQLRVKELGGRIEIRSEDDGTRVAITIPVAE